MIQAALRNNPSSDSDDEKSTHEIISEIIFGEVLVETGDAESEFTYTGNRIFSGIPDAFVFDDDTKTLRLCLLVGRLGLVALPNVPESKVAEARVQLIDQLDRIARGDESINEQNLESLGQFVYEFSKSWRDLTTIEVKVVVLGKIANSEDQIGEQVFKSGGLKNIEIKTQVFGGHSPLFSRFGKALNFS